MSDPYTVEVTFTVPGSDAGIQQRCRIVPGYTTEDDIPRIIAIARTGRTEDAVFIRVRSVRRVADY